MSFSNLDDLKNIVQSVLDKPLEPLDFEKIVAQNLHLFKGQGMNISDRWKECLENETDCAKTDLKGAPLPPEKQKESSLPGGAAPRPQQTSAAEREEADLTTPGEELLSTAYDPDEEEEEEEEE
ncbi:uncharacterized protein LOC118436444 [Folsomia candida]|nr:uncharacterized protein LOC118436444 [Folsomia candida]